MREDFKLGLKHWAGTAIVALIAGFVIFGLLRGQEALKDFLKSDSAPANLEKGEIFVHQLPGNMDSSENSEESPIPFPSFLPTKTPTSTLTPSPSKTPTLIPSSTPTPTPSKIPTPSPTPTPTPTPTPIPTLTPIPTPTLTPTPSPTPTPTPTPIYTSTPNPVLASNVNHILISEIQVGTNANGAEDEFVELYNPTSQAIDLTGWSVKKRNSSGNESNLVSSAAFSGSIMPKSFFLVAHINFKGSTPADLIYSANSNNLAYTNNSVVLYDVQASVVDEVGWIEIPKDKSYERKAWQNNCVSVQEAGELLGNGCDTDGNIFDFEIRAIPNPQNSQAQPEP